MSSSRCWKCRSITSEFVLSREPRKDPIVYDSFSSLDESSKRGCEFCAILFQYLVFSTAPNLHEEPISLSPGLGVVCGRPGKKEFKFSGRLEWCNGECKKNHGKSAQHTCKERHGNFTQRADSVKRFAPSETLNDLKLLAEEKMKPWIKTCQQNHRQCDPRSSPKKLPTRVIDVGAGNQPPRLCVPAEYGELNARYLTLSYCWGAGNSPARTTRTNFDARRRELNFTGLPKTIQDAINLTRALGERFLWVDAVCIIQPDGDDDGDWREQAPLMWQYYHHSLCTIAASRTSNSSEGFLTERLGQRYPVSILELVSWEDPKEPEKSKQVVHVHPASISNFPFNVIVDHAPLSTRGWVLQEYALSPRVLHFTEHELMWECAELRASERFPDSIDYWATGWKQPHMKTGSILSKHRDQILGEEWLRFVEQYSVLDLTYESDRLMALMGIAARAKELFDDECIFGLWKSHLALGLTWQTACYRPYIPISLCNAPSWSWASCNGVGVKYQSDDVFGNDFAVEIVRVEGDTDFTRKAGLDCRLVIRGLLEQRAFKARRTIMPKGLVVNANKWRDKATFRGDGQEIVFDSPDEIPAHVHLLSEVGNLDYLRVCVEKSVGDCGELIQVAVYLVLRKVDASGRRFRRVGLARRPVGRLSDEFWEGRQGKRTPKEIEII